MDTPYWNPRIETLPREQLDAAPAAQAARPRRVDARARAVAGDRLRARRASRAEASALARRHPPHPVHDARGLDGEPERRPAVRRRPRAAARGGHALPHDLGTSGSRPLAVLDSPEGLGVDRGDVVLRALGLRRPAGRHRLLRLQLRDLRRLLGRPLRRREARLPRAAGRQHDDRGAACGRSSPTAPPSSAPRRPTRCAWRQEAQALGIDLRQRPRPARHPLGRARRLHPRDEAAHRGAVGREGGRHRRA